MITWSADALRRGGFSDAQIAMLTAGPAPPGDRFIKPLSADSAAASLSRIDLEREVERLVKLSGHG